MQSPQKGESKGYNVLSLAWKGRLLACLVTNYFDDPGLHVDRMRQGLRLLGGTLLPLPYMPHV